MYYLNHINKNILHPHKLSLASGGPRFTVKHPPRIADARKVMHPGAEQPDPSLVWDWFDHAVSNCIRLAYRAESKHQLIEQLEKLDWQDKFDALKDLLWERSTAVLSRTTVSDDRVEWAFQEALRCVAGECDRLFYKALLMEIVRVVIKRGLISEQVFTSVVASVDIGAVADVQKSEICQNLRLSLQARAIASSVPQANFDQLFSTLEAKGRDEILAAIGRNDPAEQAADLFAAAIID